MPPLSAIAFVWFHHSGMKPPPTHILSWLSDGLWALYITHASIQSDAVATDTANNSSLSQPVLQKVVYWMSRKVVKLRKELCVFLSLHPVSGKGIVLLKARPVGSDMVADNAVGDAIDDAVAIAGCVTTCVLQDVFCACCSALSFLRLLFSIVFPMNPPARPATTAINSP